MSDLILGPWTLGPWDHYLISESRCLTNWTTQAPTSGSLRVLHSADRSRYWNPCTGLSSVGGCSGKERESLKIPYLEIIQHFHSLKLNKFFLKENCKQHTVMFVTTKHNLNAGIINLATQIVFHFVLVWFLRRTLFKIQRLDYFLCISEYIK